MRHKLATNPLPQPFDWSENIKWIETLVALLTGWITFVVFYFKHKAKEKEEFIINVVEATVKATIKSEIQGIKDDVKTLFKYRDDDRKHSDDQFKEHRDHSDSQFKELLREIKK